VRLPTHANDNDRLLTIEEAAASLSVCKKTVLRHIRTGELAYIVIGNGRQRLRRMIHPGDLLNFIDARRRFDCQSTSQPKALSMRTISKSEVFGSPVLQSALASEMLRHSKRSEKIKPESKSKH
jgi:excisionase family DNA binding protein